jgi:hypothetical protein
MGCNATDLSEFHAAHCNQKSRPIDRQRDQTEQAKCGIEKGEMSRTLTPPESGDEIARRMPVWSLGGQRTTASRIDERKSLGCRADNAKMPRGRTSRRISRRSNAHDKSNEGNDYEDSD